MQPDGETTGNPRPYADSFVVHANVWKASVGRIPLYLLDTDNELNSEFDRPITHHLYGGDWENRAKTGNSAWHRRDDDAEALV